MNGAMELLRAAQEGDRDACEQAVLENNGLIWSVVRRYYGRGVEPDDLYQLGCLGFLKAIRGFDFSYGTCFSTYAVPKIAGEIRRFLRDDGTIKVGRSIREQALTLYALRERLRKLEAKQQSVEERMEEIRLVNRAKWLLIQCLNMTEAQAHRYIEKQSMDTRVSKREVAQDIIKTYAGQPPLSDNPFSSLP